MKMCSWWTCFQAFCLKVPVCIPGSKLNHPDLQLSRIHKDEHDIQSLVDLMETSWINPLRHDQVEFTSLSTATVAPSDIANDLLKAFKVGGSCVHI